MPELPEVEVIMRGVAPHLIGNTVTKISCSAHKLRLPIPKENLQNWIKGAKIQEVTRRAKYLTISMTNGAMLVIHLGMTGNLGIFPYAKKTIKHDHACFKMDSGMELRYNDTRRFGSIQVFPPNDIAKEQFFKSLGPEPFWADYSPSYLMQKAAGKRQPVKSFLMDSRVVTGIGNIYASEILFAAAVMPTQPVGQLSAKTWEVIVVKTITILNKAIAAGGSTISDFVNSSGEKGYFQLSLQVYGRKGEKCKICNSPIEKTLIAGRATFFCPECQTGTR